jgi:hypothetical protein
MISNVAGDEHLIAHDPLDIVIVGREHQKTIIPCKPTAPDITITLEPNFSGNVIIYFLSYH